MNQANQRQLAQQTNIGLLGIRQQEINYHVNLNSTFGTQAALIGGFTYGVFTQNQNAMDYDPTIQEVILDTYWIVSAATIAVAVHVIINTMLLQVLGPGLALYGPLGSMTRAADGLHAEQKQIMTSFSYMMVLFTVSTVLSFWVIMDFRSAMLSTVVYVIAGYYWIRFTERIWLRFHWDSIEDNVHFKRNREEQERIDDSEDPAARIEAPTSNRGITAPDTGLRQRTSISNKNQGGFSGFFNRLRVGNRSTTNRLSESAELPQIPLQVMASGPNHTLNSAMPVAMEGFMAKRSVSGSTHAHTSSSSSASSRLKRSKWERFYFILTHDGLIYYYKNRQQFRAMPKNALNQRPIYVKDFHILILRGTPGGVGGGTPGSVQGDDLISEPEGSVASSRNTRSTSISSIFTRKMEGVFGMQLTPKDTVGDDSYKFRWELRIDTNEELKMWEGSLQKVSPESF